MRARADATEATRLRIMRATVEVTFEARSMRFALATVAERAGVSVQTLLRHFGSKDGLFEAVGTFAEAAIVEERSAPAGDVAAGLHALLDHYERTGDWILGMLAEERHDRYARRVTDRGRPLHRRWVQEVFAPQLQTRPAGELDVLTDLLVVATDVYTWKLLRRDRRLTVPQVHSRLLRMITAIARAEEA